MKTKFNLFVVMLLSSLCFTFTSCSDDDDDDNPVTPDYAKEIIGDYKGDIYLADGNDTPIATDAIIKVTRISDNKVKLELNQYILIQEFEIKYESDVEYANDIYSIKKGTTKVPITVEEVGEMKVDVELDGSFDKEGNSTVNIAVKIPNAPVNVVYKGEKQ